MKSKVSKVIIGLTLLSTSACGAGMTGYRSGNFMMAGDAAGMRAYGEVHQAIIEGAKHADGAAPTYSGQQRFIEVEKTKRILKLQPNSLTPSNTYSPEGS